MLNLESTRWPDLAVEDMGRAVEDEANRIDELTICRQDRMERNTRAYETGVPFEAPDSTHSPPEHLHYNGIANVCDSVVAELTENKTRPMGHTIGGDYVEQDQAEVITQWLDGQMLAAGVDDLFDSIVLDAMTCGWGVPWLYVDEGGELRCERKDPRHLLVDDLSCQSAVPRECILRDYVDRAVLLKAHEDESDEVIEAIMTAELDERDERFAPPRDTHSRRDFVRVLHAWRLPSYEGAGDGVKVMVIGGVVVGNVEPYESCRFPFPLITTHAARVGFWPTPLVERLLPIQREMNKMLAQRQMSHHLHAHLSWLVPEEGEINPSDISSLHGGQIKYKNGAAPTPITPPTMPVDVNEAIQQYESWMYEVVGMSQLSARGVVPRNLKSGDAIEVYRDEGARRYLPMKRRIDRGMVDIADNMVDLQRAEGPSTVIYEQWGAQIVVDWNDIDPGNKLRFRIQAAGALGLSLSQKAAKLERWLEKGWITFDQFVTALGAYDARAVADLHTAPTDIFRRQMALMLRTSEFIPPNPLSPLADGVPICQRYIMLAETKGAPRERVRLLEKWLGQAKGHLDRAREGAAEAAAAVPAAPLAPPMAAPGGMPPAPGGPPPMPPPMAPPGGNGMMQ